MRQDGPASQSGTGIDISTTGLGVYLLEPIQVGCIVMVTLAGGLGQPDAISTRARVVRFAPHRRGFIVGLRFVE